MNLLIIHYLCSPDNSLCTLSTTQNNKATIFIKIFVSDQMESATPAHILDELGFAWTASRLRNPSICHGLVHTGYDHCFRQFLIKLIDTGKVASKYYVMFHVIPLVLRLRKLKDRKNLPQIIGKSIYDYVKSCLFLSFLVALQRGGLCMNYSRSQQTMLSFMDNLFVFSPFSASSILFQDSSRRTQVTTYVCAKAIRSLYIISKRLLNLKFENEVCYMHMVMMAVLFYLYNHHPDAIKFREILVLIFGDQ